MDFFALISLDIKNNWIITFFMRMNDMMLIYFKNTLYFVIIIAQRDNMIKKLSRKRGMGKPQFLSRLSKTQYGRCWKKVM